MKKTIVIALATFCLLASPQGVDAQRVVILHTNDTHSQIDVDGGSGLGGVARRKVLIDSVRGAEQNVLLVDAGDAVQGSVFFTLFNGEVEQKLLNLLGYDMQILGNHEFDNGLESLRQQYSNANPMLLSSNYVFDGTPLEGMFKPYDIRRYGDHKIGFIALNINPDGLIMDENYAGMLWLDTLEVANALAWFLKHIEKVDKVVALTHIGYDTKTGTNDVDLAKNSRNIDVIIGGHSHTLVDPTTSDSYVVNLDGRDVRVLQAKNKGAWLGKVVIDFDADSVGASLIDVGARLDAKTDPAVEALLAPYRAKVDSVSNTVIGRSVAAMSANSQELLNFLSDFVRDEGERLSGRHVDMSIMNKGGIRASLPKGAVTKGDIMTILPFNNSIDVITIKGEDLLECIGVMASQDGQGVSRGVDVVYRPNGDVVSATIDGKPIEPDREYTVATISYLRLGGDYMTPLTRSEKIAGSRGVIFLDLIDSMENGSLKGRKIKGDGRRRMRPTDE